MGTIGSFGKPKLKGRRKRLAARPISPAMPSRPSLISRSFLDEPEVGHDRLVLAVDLVEEGRVLATVEVGNARALQLHGVLERLLARRLAAGLDELGAHRRGRPL